MISVYRIVKGVLRLFRVRERPCIAEVYEISYRYRHDPAVKEFIEDKRLIAECNERSFSLLYSNDLPSGIVGIVRLYRAGQCLEKATLKWRHGVIVFIFFEK